MLITLAFQYIDESTPATVTGVEGEVTDLILPSVGDTVKHRDSNGGRVTGKVTERIYEYDIPNGAHVDGTVTVTIMLRRTAAN